MPLPSSAAWRNSANPLPLVERKQLSRTTMELSTIIPTPRTRPPRVSTFSEKPIVFIAMRAARIEIGMEVPTIRDAFKSPKNRRIITMEITTAAIIVWNTLTKELLISSLLSLITIISSSGSSAIRRSMVLCTALETSPAEFSCCFFMPSIMVSLLLYRPIPSASFRLE